MSQTNDARVAVISIIVEEPGCVPAINEILHTAADSIIGRKYSTPPPTALSAGWAYPTARRTSA